MKIRKLTKMSEFNECVALQSEIWGFEDIEIVPVNLISTYCSLENPWGIVLGAFEKKKMVGFVLCLPTSQSDLYWLHMIGIKPHAQASGQNYGLKLMQELVKIGNERKIKKIVWTYDPLESVNANLYIAKMGAICTEYHEAYYSFTTSKTHRGVPADRFKAELYLANDPGKNMQIFETIRVAIPNNFQKIKESNLNEARQLRNKTRKEFKSLINKEKYIVSGFEYDKSTGQTEYILSRSTE